VAQLHEEEIRSLEEARVNQGGAAFLNHAFRLQREISAAASDLSRMKSIVRSLAGGKVSLPGADAKNEPFLDSLLADVDSLGDQFNDLKESVRSLVDLHMNFTSFEMNKFMKLLAIVGFLGLIPSVAGGLLGMNVSGNLLRQDLHLFVRPEKKRAGGGSAPFVFCGDVQFSRWEGDKPVTVWWTLPTQLPESVWRSLGGAESQ
jgi:Mg2+ and Co2+ transporter CorA